MGYSKETPNYHLPQYVADDRPSYLGDWNETMGIIDSGMQENKSDISDVDTKVVNLTTRVGNAESDIEQLQTDVATANTNASAAQQAVAQLEGNVYTKAQADQRFEYKYGSDSTAILGCIGDSILAGWSDENPSNIAAWDTYLGAALGFASGNIFKSEIGGAGFGSGTTFTEQVTTLHNAITSAGKNVNDVKLIVVGGGVNDIRNNISHQNVLQGAANCVNAIGAAFPNAEIHVFPMLIGTTGLSSKLLDLENAVTEGVQKASNTYLKRTTTHTGCWSWNYDGNDSGVSSDRLHLLAGGEQRVGTSMAIEINGGSAYREGYSFTITDAQGTQATVGYRRGTSTMFGVARNLTSIKVSDSNAALGVDKRYGHDGQCIFFTIPAENGTVIMFYSTSMATFNSYNALSNKGCYGDVCYAIESSF